MHIRHLRYFLIMFAVLFFFGGRPTEFGKENTFFHGFLIPNPVIRIGLGANLRDLLIRSSSGMKVYEVNGGYTLLGDDVEEARIKGEREALTEKFVLLVAQTNDRKEAEKIASALREKMSGRIFVEEAREAGSGGVFQVKLGDFLTRGDALVGVGRLNALGIKDVWIVREVVTLEEAKPHWILIENALQSLSRDSVLYFIPSHPQSVLSYNGRNYRGILILRSTAKGIVLVNLLNLEDYLKGVVPGELSPDQFGEIEALKAQAVAARTYAVKNMGQYRTLGYDLSDTPSSQVYGGLDAERPLSTQAVDETKGEVARYRGELINALYMSTCGGMTEDVENIFSGRPEAYLKSTECGYEKRPEWQIEGPQSLVPIPAAGRDMSPDLSELISLQVLPFRTDPAFFNEPCPFDEAVAAIRQALRVVGKAGDGFSPQPSELDFPGLARLLVSAFGWQGHVENLLLPSEVNFSLKDVAGVLARDRNNLAYCLQMGIFPFLAAGPQSAGRAVTRAEAAFALSRVLSGYGDPYHKGVFRGAAAGTIEVEENAQRKILRPSQQMFLVRNLDGSRSFAGRLTLLGGERLRWLEREGELPFLEVLFPANTNVMDRSSRFNRWQVRKSREELEAVINQHYPIGSLIDIAVRKRGPSHRVLELLMTGTERQTVARGLRIRTALGLRDILFEVDREYDAEGRVTHFVISGRGWGHGVGLCQVGAYGMAQAGAKYQDILKKYYRGVHIDKIF
jgi:stage II sporulation protein D